MYASSATLARIIVDTDPSDGGIPGGGGVSVGNGTGGSYILSTNGGTVQTSNTVFDSTGTTARSINDVPSIDDIVRLTGSIAFTAANSSKTNKTNIVQDPIPVNDGRFLLDVRARNREGTIPNPPVTNDENIRFHEQGTFGQPSDSGSMAYYGQIQSYDGSTYTRSSAGNLILNFTGESKRLQIDDDMLSGSYAEGTAWDTTYNTSLLGGTDLQIKPGYLVKPGGSYKYWLEDPDSGEDYKFCAFAFTRNLGTNQPNITLTLSNNTTLVGWTDTSANNAIAMLIVPESALGSSTQASGIDPKATSTTTISAGTTGTNPFGRTLQVVQNTNSQKTNPFIIDFPSTPNLPLNGTYQNFVLLIRYKGDPTPLTNVTLSIS